LHLSNTHHWLQRRSSWNKYTHSRGYSPPTCKDWNWAYILT